MLKNYISDQPLNGQQKKKNQLVTSREFVVTMKLPLANLNSMDLDIILNTTNSEAVIPGEQNVMRNNFDVIINSEIPTVTNNLNDTIVSMENLESLGSIEDTNDDCVHGTSGETEVKVQNETNIPTSKSNKTEIKELIGNDKEMSSDNERF